MSDSCNKEKKGGLELVKFDWRAALAAYRQGDSLGAPWESNSASYRLHSYDDVINRARGCTTGTDETDIVDCFCAFSESREFDGDVEKLLVDWARFHLHHRKSNKYGKTWKDYFQTIKYLDRNGKLSYDSLIQIAQDRGPGGSGSAGNGCLALVLPVYVFARKHNLQPRRLVKDFCQISHAHGEALRACNFLCHAFEVHDDVKESLPFEELPSALREYVSQSHWQLDPSGFVSRYPHNALAPEAVAYALYAVQNSKREEDVIALTVSLGGDVDSTLALALMLYQIVTRESLEACLERCRQ